MNRIPATPRRRLFARVPPGIAALVALAVATGVAACAPTEVIDLRLAPQATQDAMLQVQILPLGTPVPIGVGSVGPIAGYGCGATAVAAGSEAVRQLQAKALTMRASAVTDVLIGSVSPIPCYAPYGALATGTAVAPRGIPPTY